MNNRDTIHLFTSQCSINMIVKLFFEGRKVTKCGFSECCFSVETCTFSAVDMTGCGAANANCSAATWQSGAADTDQKRRLYRQHVTVRSMWSNTSRHKWKAWEG